MTYPIYALLLISIALLPTIALIWKKMGNIVFSVPFFCSISIISAIFLVWDMIFVSWNIWGFSQEFLMGVYIGNLPIEEILFFPVVSYACMVIYLGLVTYVRIDLSQDSVLLVLYGICLFSVVLFAASDGKVYTQTVGFCVALFSYIGTWYVDKKCVKYILSLCITGSIPFVIVNSILTGGTFITNNKPIVWYSQDATTYIRILSIPIEDFLYVIMMLTGLVVVYELSSLYLQKE